MAPHHNNHLLASLVIACLCLSFGAVCVSAAELAYEPRTAYERRDLEGWSCWINRRLLQRGELAEPTLKLLQVKLYDISRVVSDPALARLRAVPIWVELDDDKFDPCCCYHVSAQWLREHGFHPEKAQSVEICNAARFLDWSGQQPFMILHELAHGFHDREFGYDEPRILAAYRKAKESGRYEKVLRYTGNTERHYALNNQMEYFAEATEAYFGVNDFYPFVHAELRQFDPVGYDLLREIWGECKGQRAASAVRKGDR